ncbi:MAG TPA: Rieske 2Fe-2S domain-containing protein [Mycobacteriales bacterium]|nr:Rieske 2Fe-2S domain-containing protein [Mycobacteriales bacterium]
MRTRLSMKPTGWFQVGWSSTVPERGVVPLRYFGQDLVAWRDAHGKVHIFDAYCQHLGANLAYGGCVTDEGIRCPFHGWVWSSAGRNVSIPYQDRSNPARRIRVWPVVELNEVLFVWHDVGGREPFFEVPDFTRDVSQHIVGRVFQPALPDAVSHFPNTRIHPQVVVENVVDVQHFCYVHGTERAPVILRESVTEYTWNAVAGFGRRWADGVDRPDDRKNTITIHWAGVGVSFNAEQTPDGWRVVCIATTPVDDETSEMFGTYWLEDSPGPSEVTRASRLDSIRGALPQDIVIWDNQIWLDPPGLATSEGAGFRKLRRWTSKFYPGGMSP